ncbi:unnamed protein product [Chironomus riparius]|uniref:Uncharacterized protein n=1 Tax=Chironomus riparius TaxID=315576 RepID=A0A9N9WR45_9DIPT|nr:unnamed protein product [Chironomus riparius]
MYQLKYLYLFVAILCIRMNLALDLSAKKLNLKFFKRENMGIYEQKCFEVTKNGNAFENSMNASTISERCVKSLINLNMIDEFNEAKTLNRLSESMAEFACQNLNQTTISMTIECASQKQNQLETCVEQNYGKILSKFPETFEDINLIVSQLNCTDFKNFKECVVGELKTCDQKIPANLIATLLEDIKNETPCGIKNPKSSSSSFSLSLHFHVYRILLN